MLFIKKRLQQLADKRETFDLLKVFEYLYNNTILGSGSLNCTGAAATASLGATVMAVINGVLVTKASGSTITITGPTIANTGNVAQVWIFTLDQGGNLSAIPGNPGATLAQVTMPFVPELSSNGLPQVPIGVMTMVNASVGSFVPNSTLLNVANLGIVAANVGGPFFPIPPV